MQNEKFRAKFSIKNDAKFKKLLREVSRTVYKKNKIVSSHEGDLIFTHFGLSGPIALRCSGFVNSIMRKDGLETVKLSLDLIPHKSKGEILDELRSMARTSGEKEPKTYLRAEIPKRLADYILKLAGISDGEKLKQIPEKKLEEYRVQGQKAEEQFIEEFVSHAMKA